MRLLDALRRRFIRPSETLEGYEQPELIDVIFQKTTAYKPNGTPCPEVTGAATVLDFGGGCGLHYKQAAAPSIRWAVVETPAMVERAKEISTDQLQFFTSISDAAAWLGSVDVMHSDGALQYTPHPETTLRQLCDLRAPKMVWRRILLGEPSRELQSTLLGDNGPGQLNIKEKTVRYERTTIVERFFLDAHIGYSLHGRGRDWFRFVKESA